MDSERRKALASASIDMAKEMVLDSLPPWPAMLTTDDVRRRALADGHAGTRRGSRHLTTKALLEELERDGRVEKVSQLSWSLPKPGA